MNQLCLNGTSYMLQTEAGLSDTRLRGADEVVRRPGGFAKVERSLVNGLLPEPSPAGHRRGWMDTYHWDFAVYMNSNAKLRSTNLFYSSWKAARDLCGLFDDLRPKSAGVNAIKGKRRKDLVPTLAACGLLRTVEGPYQNDQRNLEWKQLMLMPTWPATSLAPIASGLPKTDANLAQQKRDWFMMPNALFNRGTSPWRSIGNHRGRRVIAALYCFYEATSYGAVNPNHLRLDGDYLLASDEFLLSCGETASMEDIASALSWLRYKRLLFPVGAELDAGTPYPASESRYATWAHTVARGVSAGDGVFVPLYTPAVVGAA